MKKQKNNDEKSFFRELIIIPEWKIDDYQKYEEGKIISIISIFLVILFEIYSFKELYKRNLTIGEIFFELIFTIISCVPLFLMASNWGYDFFKKRFQNNAKTLIIIAFYPIIVVTIYFLFSFQFKIGLGGVPINFLNLSNINAYLLILIDISFLSIIIAFTVLIILYNKTKEKGEKEKVLSWNDFFIFLIGGVVAGFLGRLHFGSFLGIGFVLMLFFYSKDYDREIFGFSFNLNKKDLKLTFSILIIMLIVFVPIAYLIGFIYPERFGLIFLDYYNVSLGYAVYKIIFTIIQYIYLVGLAEEMIFRCFLLIFIINTLKENRYKEIWALIISSFLFGLTHAFNSSGVGIIPYYGIKYFIIATLAGIGYGIIFLKTRKIYCAMLIHGFLDIIAIIFFGAIL